MGGDIGGRRDKGAPLSILYIKVGEAPFAASLSSFYIFGRSFCVCIFLFSSVCPFFRSILNIVRFRLSIYSNMFWVSVGLLITELVIDQIHKRSAHHLLY